MPASERSLRRLSAGEAQRVGLARALACARGLIGRADSVVSLSG